jgi:uncharacterized phage protein (TIGR01671 family)
MTREIKFRAWDSNKKEMFYSDEWWSGSNGFIEIVKIYTGYEDSDEWKNLILMQYTGLKDKNGKEMYEGDIFKYENELFKTIFDSETAGFRNISLDETSSKKFIEAEYMKIIGNIYEHPHLLETLK